MRKLNDTEKFAQHGLSFPYLYEQLRKIQREHSIRFKQLLVKEILANGPWRLDFYGPTVLIITELAKYVTINVFCLIP